MTTIVSEDGTELYAEAHGAGPAVVFSCAFSTTHENWRGQVAPLVDAGFRPVLWDYRGHGLSQAPESDAGYAFARTVDDLECIANWASPSEPVVLAGLSFGGLVSLHAALRRPERVRALALVGSGPGFKKAEAQAQWAAQQEKTAGFLRAKGCAEYVARAATTCVGRDADSPLAKVAAAAIAAQDPGALASFATRVVADVPAVIDQLVDVTQPVLVAIGAEDRAFLRAAEVMAAKLPDARKHVIAEAGHIVNIEAVDAFNALLVDFLRSCQAPGQAGPPGQTGR